MMDFQVTGTALAGDDVFLTNLSLLDQLQEGSWRVNGKGILCRTHWMRKDCAAVRAAVAGVWEKLTRLDYNGVDGQKRQAALEELTGSVRGVSRKYFDRSAFPEALEEVLDDDLCAKKELYLELREEKQNHEDDEEWRKRYRQVRYDYKVAMVRFAQEKLGVEFEKVPQGANGTYYGLDKDRRKLVVFKPGDEEQGTGQSPKLITRVKEFVKYFLGHFVEMAENPIKGQAYKVEVIASEVDELLDLGIVPTTKVESFSSKRFRGTGAVSEGSCQLYKRDGVTLDKKLGFFAQLPEFALKVLVKLHRFFGGKVFAEIDADQLQKLDLLDAIMGNIDRHPGNLLLKEKARKKCLWAIDNGSGAQGQHPANWFMRRNYGLALRLMPQSRQPYDVEALALKDQIAANQDDILAIFAKHLGDDIDKPVKVLGSDATCSIRQVVKERIAIIEQCLGTDIVPTPYAHSKIQTPYQVAAILAS